jgi:hypothetical protein
MADRSQKDALAAAERGNADNRCSFISSAAGEFCARPVATTVGFCCFIEQKIEDRRTGQGCQPSRPSLPIYGDVQWVRANADNSLANVP